MKPLLKAAALLALGLAALAVLGLAFHLVTSLLHLVIPLAVLAGIGYAAWKILGAGAVAEPGAPPRAAIEAAPPQPAGLSAEEAARQFEDLKKNRSS